MPRSFMAFVFCLTSTSFKDSPSLSFDVEELAQLASAPGEPLRVRVRHARDLDHVYDPGRRTAEHHDAVAQEQGLLEAARCEGDRRRVRRTISFSSACSRLRVWASSLANGSSISKHQRIQRERPRDRDPLLHSRRELMRESIHSALQPSHLQVPSGRLLGLFPAFPMSRRGKATLSITVRHGKS